MSHEAVYAEPPIIRGLLDLILTDGLSLEQLERDWMEVICPACHWHSWEFVKKSTISPSHLFICKRTRFGICTQRFSIAREQCP